MLWNPLHFISHQFTDIKRALERIQKEMVTKADLDAGLDRVEQKLHDLDVDLHTVIDADVAVDLTDELARVDAVTAHLDDLHTLVKTKLPPVV